jgi:RNA polymerase sigma factor FliA
VIKGQLHGAPRLTPNEREQMLLDQIPQVRFIARIIHDRLPSHVCLDDLINDGVIGLIDALNKYDHDKNVQFRSYAQFRIRGAILDSLRNLDWSPRELRRKGRLIEAAVQKLSNELGRIPEELEIADAVGLELQEYQSLLIELRGLDLGSLALDTQEESGNEADRSLALAIEEEAGPFHQCLRAEMRTILAQGIEQLSEREQQVLALYYSEELNMREIGTIIGVVESRISQIHSVAIARLRELLCKRLENRPVTILKRTIASEGAGWKQPKRIDSAA